MDRWWLGTHQGAIRAKHLGYYLDEYTSASTNAGHELEIKVPIDRTSEAIAAMLKSADIQDVTITDPPLEEVLTEAFWTINKDKDKSKGNNEDTHTL